MKKNGLTLRLSDLIGWNIYVCWIFLFIITPQNVHANWPSDGLPVAPAGEAYSAYSMIPDGDGGIFVGWRKLTGPGAPVQRIDRNGNLLWGPEGSATVDTDSIYDAYYFSIAKAPDHGVYVQYLCALPGARYYKVFVQHLDANGQRLWGATGLDVAPQAETSYPYPDFVGYNFVDDGFGGAIVTYTLEYQDSTVHHDFHYRFAATRIRADGSIAWSQESLTEWDTSVHLSRTIADSAGGAFLFYTKQENGNLYSVHIDSSAEHLSGTAPVLLFGPSLELPRVGSIFTNRPNWAPNEAMIVVETWGGYYLIHVGANGRSVYPDHGRLIVEDESYILPPALTFPIDSSFIYFATGSDGVERAKCYKFDAEGTRLFGQNGVGYDACQYNALGQMAFMSQILFLPYHGVVDSRTRLLLQGVTSAGSDAWANECGHPISSDSNYSGTLFLVQTAPDTLVLSWHRSNPNQIYLMQIYSNGGSAAIPTSVPESANPSDIPSGFSIETAYPNPTNGQIRVVFNARQQGKYAIEIINIEGRRIFHSCFQVTEVGKQAIWNWSPKEISSGIYFISILSPNKSVDIRKVVFLR